MIQAVRARVTTWWLWFWCKNLVEWNIQSKEVSLREYVTVMVMQSINTVCITVVGWWSIDHMVGEHSLEHLSPFPKVHHQRNQRLNTFFLESQATCLLFAYWCLMAHQHLRSFCAHSQAAWWWKEWSHWETGCTKNMDTKLVTEDCLCWWWLK